MTAKGSPLKSIGRIQKRVNSIYFVFGKVVARWKNKFRKQVLLVLLVHACEEICVQSYLERIGISR